MQCSLSLSGCRGARQTRERLCDPGEGNTSAKIDDDFFFVKASGKYLSEADENTFVKVKLKDALAILDAGDLTDEEIKDALFAVCADPANKMRPSVETTFHAFLLSLPDVNFVGHTHPTAVNSLLCSVNAEEIIKGRSIPGRDRLLRHRADLYRICGPRPGARRGSIRERVASVTSRSRAARPR